MKKDTIIIILVLVNLAFLSKSFVLVSNNNTETATSSIDMQTYLGLIDKIAEKENNILNNSENLQKYLVQLMEENKRDYNEYVKELASIKASLNAKNQSSEEILVPVMPVNVENKSIQKKKLKSIQKGKEVSVPGSISKPMDEDGLKFEDKVKHINNVYSTKLVASNDASYFVDTISEIFFKTGNSSKGGSNLMKKPSKKTIYNSKEYKRNYAKKRMAKQKMSISNHAEILSVDRFNKTKDLKDCLRAKGVNKGIKGFYIHLMTSDHLLEPDHVLFQTFGGLMVEIEGKDKYHYYIGNFSTSRLAKKHREKVIKARFPASKVVYFKKGKRKGKLWQFFLAPIK